MTDTDPRFDPMTGQPIAPELASFADAAVVHSAISYPPPSNDDAPQRRLTRAEVLEIRRKEREEGVDFELAKTGMTAKVRDLPFTDRTMLMGIPVDLRHSLNVALGLGHIATVEGNIPSFDDALNIVDGMDNLAKALCIAGFISPRLVLHEHEIDGSDCWLVEDLHPDEREAYQKFVMRDRDAEQEVARLATFQGAEVAEAATG